VGKSYLDGLADIQELVRQAMYFLMMAFQCASCHYRSTLRIVLGTILQALQGKAHKKVELNATSGVELTLI